MIRIISNHGELCVVLVFFPKVTLAAHGVLEVSSDDITVNEVMAALQETARGPYVNPAALSWCDQNACFLSVVFSVFSEINICSPD